MVMQMMTAKEHRAVARRAYMRALADECAALYGVGPVACVPLPGGFYKASVGAPNRLPCSVQPTETLALAAMVLNMGLPPAQTGARAVDPLARIAAVARAADRTGVWMPLPGDVVEAADHVVLASSPPGKIGWTVTWQEGFERYAVRAQADAKFRGLVGRFPVDRPAGVRPEAAYGSYAEECEGA